MKLHDFKCIIDSMRILSLVNAQTFQMQANVLKTKYTLLTQLMQSSGIDIRYDHTIRVFICNKELFGSTFAQFDIQPTDYVIGNIVTKGTHITMDQLSELQIIYNIQYYVLNANMNNAMYVQPIVANAIEIDDIELNTTNLIAMYYTIEKAYIWALAQSNQCLYKGTRLHNANNNLDKKIQIEINDAFKKRQSEINGRIVVYEGSK